MKTAYVSAIDMDWDPQLQVTEVLYVVLHIARLAQSLQLLPCLLLFYDGGEGRR